MCECEHKDHFDGLAHEYMKVPATKVADSTYGAFGVCERCLQDHVTEWIEVR